MHLTPAKLAEDGIIAYTFSAYSTRKLAPLTFPAFSLLIIFFVFLAFTLNPLDSNAFFQASSLPFRPSSDPLTNDKSKTQSSSFGHPHLISGNSASCTMINKKGHVTEP